MYITFYILHENYDSNGGWLREARYEKKVITFGYQAQLTRLQQWSALSCVLESLHILLGT